MKKPKSTKELIPSERGNIIWLSKSGYTPEAIAREARLPLEIIVEVNREYWRIRGISGTALNPITGNLRL